MKILYELIEAVYQSLFFNDSTEHEVTGLIFEDNLLTQLSTDWLLETDIALNQVTNPLDDDIIKTTKSPALLHTVSQLDIIA